MQNPFEIILRFQNFSKFFFRKINFLLFRPICCKGEKREVREKSFLMLFYSAKFNWDRFTISNFSSFFQKVNFLTASTLYCTGEKNHFLVIFQSAKSVSDHFTISIFFQVFFRKINFFTISNPILLRWETRSQKKSFLVLFYSAKSNSDHLMISNFSSFFRKINFRPLYCTIEKNEVSKK